MQKVKNTIPVYDICSLSGAGHLHEDIIAERFADYLKVHPNLYRAHGHTFYHLVLFTKGSGTYTIDFERFKVKPGQAYFMVPGQVHSWAFDGETDGYIVNFSDELLRSFITDGRYLDRFPFWSGMAGEGVLQLTTTDAAQAAALLAGVVAETKQVQPFNIDQARLSLLSFFILAARSVSGKEATGALQKSGQLTLYQFRKLVNEHYHQYRLPKDYAALLYITPNHLNALCKDLLGKPAGEVIRERILLEAKRQLVNAGTGIAEIAYGLGFADNSYFTKFFKKYTGATPEDFRRGWQ